MVLPEYLLHIFFTLFFVLSMQLGAICWNLPLVAYHVHRFSSFLEQIWEGYSHCVRFKNKEEIHYAKFPFAFFHSSFLDLASVFGKLDFFVLRNFLIVISGISIVQLCQGRVFMILQKFSIRMNCSEFFEKVGSKLGFI